MDFLQNLSLTDEKKEQPKVGLSTDAASTHPSTFLEKILENEGKHGPPVVPQTPAKAKASSLIDMITGDHGEEHTSPGAALLSKPQNESFPDKILKVIHHDQPPPVVAKEENHSLLDQVFHVHKDSVPPPRPPPAEEHDIIGKLSHILQSGEEDKMANQEHPGGIFGLHLPGHNQEVPHKDDSIVDFISTKLGHKQDQPPPPQGLKARVNALLGGGPQSERNEDGLDKAIDFVQEHILKQGDQSNESAWQQMSDAQIANAIRAQYKAMTGHEFPLKDKRN